MATTMYAWTDIRNGSDRIKAGDKVTKGSFDEDDWDQLVEARSIRPKKYPDIPKGFTGSPREFMVKQLNEQLAATEEMLSDDDIVANEREIDAEVETDMTEDDEQGE